MCAVVSAEGLHFSAFHSIIGGIVNTGLYVHGYLYIHQGITELRCHHKQETLACPTLSDIYYSLYIRSIIRMLHTVHMMML